MQKKTANQSLADTQIYTWFIRTDGKDTFTRILDEIIDNTMDKEHSHHAWISDLNSSLWLWTGILGKNIQFRSNYFLNFFNKVLLNTIQGHQVFCFVPMLRYHPKTIKTENQGNSDTTYNFKVDDLQTEAGYFPSNAGKICFFLSEVLGFCKVLYRFEQY